jgi:predicted O-methyltransferase YrrM
MTEFLERFDREWAPLLAHRRDTFRRAFEHLLARGRPPFRIVETGCVRSDNWAGDGRSTVLFDRFVEMSGGELVSIDLSPEACAYARREVGERSRVLEGDSVRELRRIATELLARGEAIDLLFLDSLDADPSDSRRASEQALLELCAARPALRPGSLVMVDDAYRALLGVPRGDGGFEVLREVGPSGKGALVSDYFRRVGQPLLFDGYQRGWIHG